MFVVNKEMTIGEVIRKDPETAKLLNQYGMHCTSCPFSQMESLEQAGMVPWLRCGRPGQGAERILCR